MEQVFSPGTTPTVSILGPLLIDGLPVTPRQRLIVSMLVLHRRHGVGADTLIDAVWGERVPTTARASLQNQIARLRAAHGRGLIDTTGGRYRLRARTDVDRFDEIVGSLLPLHAGCVRPADELRSVREALVLWRGSPYQDFDDHPEMYAERSRLDFLHGLALEHDAVLHLDAGAHHVAIGSMTNRLGSHPLHERAWELLVIALHLAGRRTEALAAYVRFARMLDRELGARPTTTFTRLRDAIADDEPLDLTSMRALIDPNPAPARTPTGRELRVAAAG